MSDMVCDHCGKTGIRWRGPLAALTHTECPHCGGINCQRVDPEFDDISDGDDPASADPEESE